MKALKDTWPVVVSILTATGFLWLNVPTKSDFDRLESKIARLESKMTTKDDLRNLETTITTALAIYRDEVKQVKSELQKHTLNYAAHK